jgi:GT2 family glycosyltransferase
MNVHICIPYSITKNLGAAYNETMARIPDGDAACFIDYDVQLLTPDAGKIIHEYANLHPNSLLTCFTNRATTFAKAQLLTGVPSEDTNIRNHIDLAEKQKEHLYKVTPILKDISGFLMVLSKSLWRKHPFPDNGHCLGIDTSYSRSIRRAGLKVLRMDGLYVFHQYRLVHGILNRSHLV